MKVKNGKDEKIFLGIAYVLTVLFAVICLLPFYLIDVYKRQPLETDAENRAGSEAVGKAAEYCEYEVCIGAVPVDKLCLLYTSRCV